MRAGDLTTRVRIEQKVENEYDAAGHPVEKWKLFADVWGEKQELSAGETERTSQNQPSSSLTFKIRYTKGVNSGMRLKWQEDKVNHVAGIEGVTKDRKRTEMLLTCREAL